MPLHWMWVKYKSPAGTVAALPVVARLRAELEHMARQRGIVKKVMAIVS